MEHGTRVKKRPKRDRQQHPNMGDRFVDEVATLPGVRRVNLGDYGHRFILPTMDRVDYWPSTGVWNIVTDYRFWKGPKKMVEVIKHLIATKPRFDEPPPRSRPQQSDKRRDRLRPKARR